MPRVDWRAIGRGLARALARDPWLLAMSGAYAYRAAARAGRGRERARERSDRPAFVEASPEEGSRPTEVPSA